MDFIKNFGVKKCEFLRDFLFFSFFTIIGRWQLSFLGLYKPCRAILMSFTHLSALVVPKWLYGGVGVLVDVSFILCA